MTKAKRIILGIDIAVIVIGGAIECSAIANKRRCDEVWDGLSPELRSLIDEILCGTASEGGDC